MASKKTPILDHKSGSVKTEIQQPNQGVKTKYFCNPISRQFDNRILKQIIAYDIYTKDMCQAENFVNHWAQ
jgi:hypothetical protein